MWAGTRCVSIRHSRLDAGVEERAFVYYTHSYRAPADKRNRCGYRIRRSLSPAPWSAGNVMGVQFHPEKSGTAGMRVLRNFVELAC